MMINTELYKTFYIVAKEGSITKASEILFITQPAVSRAIQQLEEKSGCSLFFRTPKGVKLTKEGQVLYKYIEQAFNFIYLGEKKLEEIKTLEQGEFTIGVGDTVCKHYLIPHLKEFNRTYPGVRIHIVNHTTPVIIDMLKKGKIDLGIANLPIDEAEYKELIVHNIMEIQDCFVVGEKFKKLSQGPVSISDLVKFPMLLLEKESNSRIYIEKYLAKNNIVIRPEIELGNFELLVRFAMIDFGVACVIKNFVTYELDRNFLYEITLKEQIPPRNLGVVYLNSIPLSAAAGKFLSFLSP
ncbi:MAG TPA: LysR family transcriptional regulator [Pseudobacteroides sp.]|uniref:LysR family transcriptional regulator n=1 Tax=Pseudobacteroides sp. TaxID=1968840 RepID=UPI002F94FC55